MEILRTFSKAAGLKKQFQVQTELSLGARSILRFIQSHVAETLRIPEKRRKGFPSGKLLASTKTNKYLNELIKSNLIK